MNKHREILNKILADLIANLELDQVEQLQKMIIEMTASNNAKVTKAFVKFESEMPSETCEKIDVGSAELPFNKTKFATSTPRISDAWSAKHAADRILARCVAEAVVDDAFRKEMRKAQFMNLNSQFGKFGNRYSDRLTNVGKMNHGVIVNVTDMWGLREAIQSITHINPLVKIKNIKS